MDIIRITKNFLKKPYYFCRRTAIKSGLMPLSIPLMVVTVGQACTYKCINCCNLAPDAPREFMRYKIDDIIGWLEHVFANLDEVRDLQLEGGEPFLHPELGRLVEFVCSSGKARKVTIATNSSIVPSDELLDTIKKCGAVVRVSDYDVTPDSKARLLRKLEQRGVRHSVFSFARGMGMWFDQGRKDFKQGTDKEVKKRFACCIFKGCFSLERGQFSRCGRATNAPVIQGFTARDGDYLVLADYPGRKLRNGLIDYYYRDSWMEACRYCRGTDKNHMIKAAVQP